MTASFKDAETVSNQVNLSNKKKLFIKTYGCQMNVYDSQRMVDVLGPIGYEVTDTPDDADMVILNTCHIREKAAEKVYSDLGRLRPKADKKEAAGGRMLVAVAGCVAQAEGEEIMRRAPMVDMVFGPQTYHRLPEMVAKASRKAGIKVLDTDFPAEDKFDFIPLDTSGGSVTAFLTVQEGCDKFCTFCVVPYTRGAEVSRPVASLEKEARILVESGVREITLLGQNVNGYHGEAANGQEWGLARLIRHLAEIDGLERIRFITSHPRDMGDDLIAAHRDIPQLMPYLHLPIQSGSDAILKAMNRKHTADDYRRAIDKLRDARPDLAMTSDFIVGFPGETDADFAETIKLVTDVNYAAAFSFKYSPRPGTPAAASDAQVPEDVKVERLKGLQQLLEAQQAAFNAAQLGRTLPVLFEKSGREEGQIVGRSPYLQPVHVNGPMSLIGTIADCHITDIHGYSLFADITSDKKTNDLDPERKRAFV